MGAPIAQWIRLCLPSYGPGLNPQHTIYAFKVNFVLYL